MDEKWANIYHNLIASKTSLSKINETYSVTFTDSIVCTDIDLRIDYCHKYDNQHQWSSDTNRNMKLEVTDNLTAYHYNHMWYQICHMNTLLYIQHIYIIWLYTLS